MKQEDENYVWELDLDFSRVPIGSNVEVVIDGNLGPEMAQQMADKGAVWDAIVKKHDLRPHGFEEIAQWPFGDFTFGAEWDFMLDMTKARTYGFHDAVDSEEMFLRMFAEMRRDKIIP